MHYPAAGQPTDLQFQYRYEYSGSFIQYEGVAPASAGETDNQWVIKKYSNDGTNVTKVVFADDSIAFNKAWNDRANYSYK